jgi:hypothetical protein
MTGAMTLSGQVVDTPAARELLAQALERISRDDCRTIAADCARKSSYVQALLPRGRCAELDEATLRSFLGCVFATRRRADGIVAAAQSSGGLGPLLEELCWGAGAVDRRVDQFVEALSDLSNPELACDLAGEALHHTQPEAYWLLSRWLWNPVHRTGALALVTTDADLVGESPGETYAKVGRALVMVRASVDAAGLLDMGPEPWNLDVLLACVYGVYVYTVTRMRMTQEFNKVIPPLGDLARRILGVHKLNV